MEKIRKQLNVKLAGKPVVSINYRLMKG